MEPLNGLIDGLIEASFWAQEDLMRRITIGLLVASALFGAALPALAGQLDAKTDPSAEGPIAKDTERSGCRRQKLKQGKMRVATFVICRSYWNFDPASESDASKDYGAVWIQSSVQPNRAKGWCMEKAKLRITLPSQGIDSKAPTRFRSKSKKRKRAVTKLAIEPAASNGAKATMKQRYALLPGTTRSGTKDAVHHLTWRGHSGKKAAFATGYAISWNTVGGKPPAPDPHVEGFFRMTGDC